MSLDPAWEATYARAAADRPLASTVEQMVLDTLRSRHVEHLAVEERLRGIEARTLEPVRVFGHLDDGLDPLAGQTIPCILIGVVGAASEPRHDLDVIDVVWRLALGVWVHGTHPRDARLRRDVYLTTAIETVLGRTPHTGGICGIRLVDVEHPPPDEVQRRYAAHGRATLDVTTQAAYLTQVLPRDGTGWETLQGLPGGPPAAPYEPPAPPPVLGVVSNDIVKETIE